VESIVGRAGTAIDGDRLLRDLRLPYYSFAQLREMRVGDHYVLFDFTGPPVFGLPGAEPSVAGATMERIRGGIRLTALWMLHVGRGARRRPHVVVPGITLQLLSGRQVRLIPDHDGGASEEPRRAGDGLRLFTRVVRFAHRLADLAQRHGDLGATEQMRPVLRKRDRRRFGDRVEWLDRIAGPLAPRQQPLGRVVSGLSTCIECGCTDTNACWDDEAEAPCHWLAVDVAAGVGVCSACPDAQERWDAGDRAIAVPVRPHGW